MNLIHGMGAPTPRLLAEDQTAVLNNTQNLQPSAGPVAEAPAPAVEPLPAPTVEAARSPQEAVAALHALPPPDNSDMAHVPGSIQQSVVTERNQVYNATRAEAAQTALEAFKPERSDYAGLHPGMANYEFQSAQDSWQSNAYAQELQRIVDEATASPDTIPPYLLTSDASTADVSQFTPQQISDALGMVGLEFPADASADMLAAGRELLGTMPDGMLATVINPGMQVSFEGGGGLSTPNIAGPSGGFELEVGGEVSLGNVQTGVDFEQTQQFEASVQTQAGTTFDLSKSLPQQINKWAGRVENLSGPVRDALDKVPGFDRLQDTLGQARGKLDDIPALKGLLKGLPVSGSYSTFEGARLSYEAVVTPEQGARLADGDTDALPNPLDPLSMPAGTSVLMRGQELQGSAFELNYKAFTLGGTHTELSGQGFGVTRAEGSIVEVYAGPVETVENTMFLGLGRQGSLAVGIGTESSSETREMQIARIDLSTAEGQAAYQQFIASGQVPSWAPPGVPQSGTTEIYSHESSRFAGLQAGGLTIGISGESSGSIAQTTWADGSIDYTNSYTTENGVTSEVSFQMGADGKPDYDNATWTVVRADLDPTLANYLQSAYDPSKANQVPDNNQHVQMQLSTDELMSLHDRARDYVAATPQGEQKLESLDNGSVSLSSISRPEALAIAQTPEEVFAVLSDAHGGLVIESLLAMSFQGDPLPGQFRIRDAG